MKQQKFFVGDKVVRTQYMGNYEPINGSVAIVTAVELDEEDGNFYLRFKDLPSEKWDADYFSIVERSWQENAGDYSANNAPVDEDTYIEVLFEGSTSPSVVMVEKEWWENTKGMVKWRIADEYENPEAFFDKENANTTPTENVDYVNSPKHYAFFGDVEAIEIIASAMSIEMFKGYCMGNSLKYRLRAGGKDRLEQEIAKADKYKELYEKHKYLCKGEVK